MARVAGVTIRLIAISSIMALHPPVGATSMVQLQTPSSADAGVTQFDDPNVIIAPRQARADAPLLVFFPGTSGRPENLVTLLQVAADQGYRVIGLSYDNVPAVDQVCPRDPDAACAEHFRQSRLTGSPNTPVATPPSDAIITRLRKALAQLAQTHSEQGWQNYLTAGGAPNWPRIAVGGFSQGAGMAALIAKLHPVQRVILFSGPWDTSGPARAPAPWLALPSATPASRWWAERHAREKTTKLLAHAYQVLGIPKDQILIFDEEVAKPNGDNPYHPSTVRRLGYLRQWQAMFGTI